MVFHSTVSAKVGKKAKKYQLSKPETGLTSPGYEGPRVARSSLMELGMIRSTEAAHRQGEVEAVLGNTCVALEGMSCTDMSRQAFAVKHLVCSGWLSPSASLPGWMELLLGWAAERNLGSLEISSTSFPSALINTL